MRTKWWTQNLLSVSQLYGIFLFSSLFSSSCTDVNVFTCISDFCFLLEHEARAVEVLLWLLWLNSLIAVPPIFNILPVAFKSQFSEYFLFLLFRNLPFFKLQPLKINSVSLTVFSVFLIYLLFLEVPSWMFEVCVLWVFMCSGFREQVQNCFFTQGIPDAVISKPKAGLVNSASQLM